MEVLSLKHRLAYILCSSSYQMSIVAVENKNCKLDRSVQSANMALKSCRKIVILICCKALD